MKDNVLPVNTFPPIINWQFAFFLLQMYYSDVSSDNGLSVDEDFISMGRLVILPPNYLGDRGGDENDLLPNNLTGVNLLLVLLLILVHQL